MLRVIGISGLIILMVGLLSATIHASTTGSFVHWGLLLMILGLSLFYGATTKRAERLEERIRFRMIFDFSPRPDDYDQSRALARKRVETVLESLATNFMEADFDQRKFGLVVQRVERLRNWEMSRFEKRRRELERAVEKTKDRFWEAVALAQRLEMVHDVDRYEEFVPRDKRDQIASDYQSFGQKILAMEETGDLVMLI